MRKDELMQAGMTLFSTKGYYKTKVADIVKAAGVAQGTFYLYFDSKADLFAALLDRFIGLISEAVSSVTLGLDAVSTQEQFAARIRLAVESVLAVFRDNASLARIVIREGSGLDPQLTDKWEEAIDRLAQIGTAALDEAIEKKLIPPQNTKIVAYCVLGMYERVAHRWVVEEQSMDLDGLADALTRFEMLGIGGTASPETEAAITGERRWAAVEKEGLN